MLRPRCGHGNPEDHLFCEQCAAGLAPVRPFCSQENNQGARFFRHCQTPLSGEANYAQPQPHQVITGPAERQTSSFVDGRCQVKGFLGDAGKMKVCLSPDTLLEREPALTCRYYTARSLRRVSTSSA